MPLLALPAWADQRLVTEESRETVDVAGIEEANGASATGRTRNSAQLEPCRSEATVGAALTIEQWMAQIA